jgi:hypothetical protein
MGMHLMERVDELLTGREQHKGTSVKVDRLTV